MCVCTIMKNDDDETMLPKASECQKSSIFSRARVCTRTRTHARTHIRTHARTHVRARARTHTHTQIQRVNCTPTMVSELLECVWDGSPTRSPPVPSIQQIRCNALPLRCMVVLK